MNTRRILASVAAVALALSGCTDAAQAPLAPAPPPAAPAHLVVAGIDVTGLLSFISIPGLLGPRHAEKHIVAAEGGFVELNGFRVDIPAGALPADTTVTIDLPSNLLLAQRVTAAFGPDGLAFNEPVTISFPLTGVLVLGPVQVSRWEGDHWVGLGGWLSGGGTRLNGTTPHFSQYGGTYIMAGG